jgi:hypothetical protein
MKKKNNAPVRGFWDWLTGGGGSGRGVPRATSWAANSGLRQPIPRLAASPIRQGRPLGT